MESKDLGGKYVKDYVGQISGSNWGVYLDVSAFDCGDHTVQAAWISATGDRISGLSMPFLFNVDCVQDPEDTPVEEVV